MVHRDLKPGNILLKSTDEGEHVKVVDFGLVKVIDESTQITRKGQVLGSPRYMAPEQIRDADVDQRADIYSLGVILYQCLTGKAPFVAPDTSALLAQHLQRRPLALREAEPALELPAVVEWTVMRCLEKDPDRRFDNAGELKTALKACRRALSRPEQWDVVPVLREGCVVLPDGLGEHTESLDSLTSAAAAAAATRSGGARHRRLFAALGGMALLAGALGAWLVLRPAPPPLPAPVAPVVPEPEGPAPPDSAPVTPAAGPEPAPAPEPAAAPAPRRSQKASPARPPPAPAEPPAAPAEPPAATPPPDPAPEAVPDLLEPWND